MHSRSCRTSTTPGVITLEREAKPAFAFLVVELEDLLLPMSMHIEDKGLDAAEPGVLLACFQEARHFTPGTRARFGRLAARAALTGALGSAWR